MLTCASIEHQIAHQLVLHTSSIQSNRVLQSRFESEKKNAD